MSLLRGTVARLSRAKGYYNRVMCYAHRRDKARYRMPRRPYRYSPLANKMPEEYGDATQLRNGVDWYYRLRHANHYRHWPWARWSDDPIRHHEDATSQRTLSVRCAGANAGVPEWDYYKEVGQDYSTPSHFPLTYVVPFIYQYTGKHWSREQLHSYLTLLQEGTGCRTIADAVANVSTLRAWGELHGDVVPLGVVLHVQLVTHDVVEQNARKAFRQQQHEHAAVLRTRDMKRYYTLPYLRGPAMPVTLQQPSGAYPYGEYTYLQTNMGIHPLQLPDRHRTQNMYPP